MTVQAVILNAQSRQILGKQVKQLKAQGLAPAVSYGHKKESRHLAVNARDFMKILRQAGHSTLVDLVVDAEKPVKVLIHDVQTDPVHGKLQHVDFYLVNLKEKLRVMVPIKYIGTPEVVDLLGGIFIAVKDEVEIECLPDKLVHEFEIDITGMRTFDDTFHVKDIVVGEGVEILDDADEVIASISEPISEEELAELEKAPEITTVVESETKSGTDAVVPPEEGAKEAEKAE